MKYIDCEYLVMSTRVGENKIRCWLPTIICFLENRSNTTIVHIGYISFNMVTIDFCYWLDL